jgi:hypothetical protein
VEQADVQQPAPTVDPSASASAEPLDEAAGSDDLPVESDGGALPAWPQPDNASDDDGSSGFKWDGKPGRGHGRWNR